MKPINSTIINLSADSESRLSDEQEMFMKARKVELVTVAHVPD
eukprot:gene10622-19363_t